MWSIIKDMFTIGFSLIAFSGFGQIEQSSKKSEIKDKRHSFQVSYVEYISSSKTTLRNMEAFPTSLSYAIALDRPLKHRVYALGSVYGKGLPPRNERYQMGELFLKEIYVLQIGYRYELWKINRFSITSDVSLNYTESDEDFAAFIGAFDVILVGDFRRMIMGGLGINLNYQLLPNLSVKGSLIGHYPLYFIFKSTGDVFSSPNFFGAARLGLSYDFNFRKNK